jgi:hypothetical protein
MDVLSLLRLVIRHWRATTPAALLTVIGLVAAFQFSSPTYEATGSVVLLGPPEPPDVTNGPASASPPDVGQNPFARYGDLSVVADILARVMDSDSKRAEFESEGVSDYAVVANGGLQRGPVVEVTGHGPNPEAATGSADLVLKEVDTVLSELQKAESADPDYFINTAPLDPPSTATAMYGSTLRAAIAVLALGVLGTLGLAVLAEARARRRTVWPSAAAGPVTSDAASPRTEGVAANGTRKSAWSAILPALRSARVRPSRQEPARRQEPSPQEPAMRVSARPELSPQEPATRVSARPEPSPQEPAKQEPAWQKTFQQEASSEVPADNGHKPTTGRST